MKKFEIYIKSHSETPDFEEELNASSRAEAIEMFYDMLEGEFDRDFINENIREVNYEEN